MKKNTQYGISLIEVIGALAIGALVFMSITTMVDSSLADAKGQQTALYQEQVVNAANKYITTNYKELADNIAVGTVGTVTLAQLKTGGFLSNSFSSTNVFNQTPCVLVRQSSSNKFDALVATYGGLAIPERDLPYIAMNAGQGGGYISTAAPGTARGASWSLATTNYQGVACGGTTVLNGSSTNDGGHLVSSLFYDGPGQLFTDFLYRKAVPGREDLNQMTTPLHMVPDPVVTEGTTDSRCTAASDNGKIAVDASGRVLSCQSGVWKGQGSDFWKDPKEKYTDLPSTGNTKGDVRMVTDLNRAFTYDGSNWVALAVDELGNFQVQKTITADSVTATNSVTANLVTLNQVAVKNASCTTNGMIARDATGLTLSCQNGSWRNPLDVRLNSMVYFHPPVTLHGTDSPEDITIDLTTLPGGRPLYFVGSFDCHATGSTSAYVYGDMYTTSFWYSSIGTCRSQLDSSGNGVRNTMNSTLNKIPEDISTIHLRVEPGAAAGDWASLLFIIYDTY